MRYLPADGAAGEYRYHRKNGSKIREPTPSYLGVEQLISHLYMTPRNGEVKP